MAAKLESDIILYDLGSLKGTCFSPTVWRVRLMLNYKKISYETVFLEFPDIAPTLEKLGLVASDAPDKRYTVPVIYHRPTNRYIMDSAVIMKFLESYYPSPVVVLTSDLGKQIESRSRASIGTVLRKLNPPHEIHLLCPRSQEYFRSMNEMALGKEFEDLSADGEEERLWKDIDDEMRAVGKLIKTNSERGPFILGDQPSATDFFVAGALQSTRMINEDNWKRIVDVEGFEDLYQACLQWMEKNN